MSQDVVPNTIDELEREIIRQFSTFLVQKGITTEQNKSSHSTENHIVLGVVQSYITSTTQEVTLDSLLETRKDTLQQTSSIDWEYCQNKIQEIKDNNQCWQKINKLKEDYEKAKPKVEALEQEKEEKIRKQYKIKTSAINNASPKTSSQHLSANDNTQKGATRKTFPWSKLFDKKTKIAHKASPLQSSELQNNNSQKTKNPFNRLFKKWF